MLLVGRAVGNEEVDPDREDEAAIEETTVVDQEVEVVNESVIVVAGTEVVKVVGKPATGVDVVNGLDEVVGVAEEV